MVGPEYTQFDNEEYYDAPAEWSIDIASYTKISNNLDDEIYSMICGVQGYEVHNMAYIGAYEPGYNIYRIWIYSDSMPNKSDVMRNIGTLTNFHVIAIDGRLV